MAGGTAVGIGEGWRRRIGGTIFVSALGVGLALAQEEPAPRDNPYLLSLISWFPMIALIGVWIFFMRRMGFGAMKKVRERTIEHMDAMEKKLDRIADVLERRSQ